MGCRNQNDNFYDPDEETTGNTQWHITDNGTFTPGGRTVSELPASAYECYTDSWGQPFFKSIKPKNDELVSFPKGISADVLEEIDNFWDKQEQYKKYGFLHKRGYMFYGPPGCGKTSLITQIVDNIVKRGHVAMFCQNLNNFLSCVVTYRELEKNRPIVCIFEDIDSLIESYGDAAILQWLDGNKKIEKVVTIASTNYPEKLDKRIIARPRRFDRLIAIGSPDEFQRQEYLKYKMPEIKDTELENWVALSNGISFAGLADLVISVKCMDKKLEEAVSILKKIEEENVSSTDFFNEYDGDEE